ncbi:MAG: DUF2384 domain-containing protein [Sphingobacteriaceae bacterium]|nr:MAG: DUF2384 domain-containing protein [Sphingobacteriaceae bacterium]
MAQNQKHGKILETKVGQRSVSAKTGASIHPQKISSRLSKLNTDIVTETWQSDNYLLAISIIIDKTGKAEWQMTPVEKMQLVKDGLSKTDLEKLKTKTNLDYDKLSILLSTARATLINKKGTAQFNTSISEKILSIADVYSYGFKVFEDETKFNEWVFKPNRALGGKQPFELLDNQFGREEVKNLIGRIDYGVYS